MIKGFPIKSLSLNYLSCPLKYYIFELPVKMAISISNTELDPSVYKADPKAISFS